MRIDDAGRIGIMLFLVLPAAIAAVIGVLVLGMLILR